MDILNRLCKWRNYYASWQIGRYAKGEREYDAIADHRELTILMRAEVSALCGLMIEKGVFTADEFMTQLEAESIHLMEMYMHNHPGVYATDLGLELTEEAPEFLKGDVIDGK